MPAPPGTTGACDLLGSPSCLRPPGRDAKGCWLRPRPAEAWAVAQGASGRPSPLLTPALQLGLWSLRWLAWLGSRAAEGHRSCQGQPRPPAAPSRLGWEPQRSEHTEQVGDARRPSGTASRPFLSFPNTWEEREPWDGVSPVRLSPQSSRGPAGRADHPQERGRGHLWASPTTNCQTGARAPCPTGAREGLSTQCPRGPSTSTRDNTPGHTLPQQVLVAPLVKNCGAFDAGVPWRPWGGGGGFYSGLTQKPAAWTPSLVQLQRPPLLRREGSASPLPPSGFARWAGREGSAPTRGRGLLRAPQLPA